MERRKLERIAQAAAKAGIIERSQAEHFMEAYTRLEDEALEERRRSLAEMPAGQRLLRSPLLPILLVIALAFLFAALGPNLSAGG